MVLNTFNLFTGLWMALYNYIIISLIFKHKQHKILPIIFFGLLHFINLTYANIFMEMIFYLFLIITFCCYEVAKPKSEIIFLIYLTYTIRFLFEILLVITLYLLKIPLPSQNLMYLMTSLLTIILTFTLQDNIQRIIAKPNFTNHSTFQNLLFINSYLIFIFFSKYLFLINSSNILSLLTTFIIFNLGFILLVEKSKQHLLLDNFQNTLEYYKNIEDLLTKYKSRIHEIKNQLIIIKSLVKDNEELTNYISLILNEKNANEWHWLTDLKNIPIPGLKGLINYKILKMQEQNITTEIYVGDNINLLNDKSFSPKDKKDLYTIIGIITDNALEAALESQDKMIAIHIYLENNQLIFLIANTYKFIELNHIHEKGYSTKGKNRGMGLYLVDDTINKNAKITKDTDIKCNFFYQKIGFNIQ